MNKCYPTLITREYVQITELESTIYNYKSKLIETQFRGN